MQDPSELAESGAKALDSMSSRMHNDSRNEVESCRCGALVVVPGGDSDVLCDDCDRPLGDKIYDALR